MKATEFSSWLRSPRRRPLVMGILNVTPDSFSDGGKFAGQQEAYVRAMEMIAQGADIIDIGGESTRPGAERVSDDEQIRRVLPVIERIIEADSETLISIDTTRASVARAALDAGAGIINDVSAGRDDSGIFTLAARRNDPIILMHMQGEPRTMQQNPTYTDVVAEVNAFLKERIEAAERFGIPSEQIIIDPGIGFGKTTTHNLQLLGAVRQFKRLPNPLLIGASRKRFIGELTARAPSESRLMGTAAAVAWSVTQGADIVRVHDVQEMVDVVKVADAIRSHAGQ